MAVAIIGAGMAGAACARQLHDAGQTVTLFDKGRGPGGRMSTRRAETPLGEVRFDHGAQYVSARTPAFRAVMERWGEAGATEPWSGPFAQWTELGPQPVTPPTRRWVGTPGMNALVRAALEGLDARFAQQVAGFEGGPGDWRLLLEAGESVGPFDRVVCATPAEQTAVLLAPVAADLAAQAEAAVSAPCWSVMAVFSDPPPVLFAAISPEPPSPLAWCARQCSKPGRTPLASSNDTAAEAWVLHASPAWSRSHLEDAADDVAQALTNAFCTHVDAAAPVWSSAHRWRYAMVERPAGAPFGWNGAQQIGTCGDWRLGPRVELAWTSGDALGRALARM